jgi:hypothetical protein
MELPPNVFFRPDLRLMIFRPRGILNEDQLAVIVAFLEKEEERAKHAFNRFTDLSTLDAIDLSIRSVIQVSLHRRLTYARRPPVKSAFYTPNETTAKLVRVHELVTEQSALQVEMFSQISKAAEWLGVTQRDLHPTGNLE